MKCKHLRLGRILDFSWIKRKQSRRTLYEDVALVIMFEHKHDPFISESYDYCPTMKEFHNCLTKGKIVPSETPNQKLVYHMLIYNM